MRKAGTNSRRRDGGDYNSPFARSSLSMSSWKAASDCSPSRIRPLMKKVGVPSTPSRFPSSMSPLPPLRGTGCFPDTPRMPRFRPSVRERITEAPAENGSAIEQRAHRVCPRTFLAHPHTGLPRAPWRRRDGVELGNPGTPISPFQATGDELVDCRQDSLAEGALEVGESATIVTGHIRVRSPSEAFRRAQLGPCADRLFQIDGHTGFLS